MSAFLKRQWFLVLIAGLLLATIIFFVYDQNKDNLPAKSVGGKDVVFSVAGTDVTTDELYAKLYDKAGIDIVYMLFERGVVNAAVADTDVIRTKAQVDADSVTANFKDYYGDAYETYILNALKGLGYSKLEDLTNYFMYTYKLQELTNGYIDANMDTLYPAFNETNKPRIVSHVLIKMDDPKNPTADEKARFEEAKAAYASGTRFEEMVTKYSDDTSNNTTKGVLGYVDKNTQYETAFLDAAMALNEGQVSDWIETSYGYHLIRVDAANLDALKEYQEFYSAIAQADTKIQATVIWNKAEELNVDFLGNDELKAKIMSYMGIEE